MADGYRALYIAAYFLTAFAETLVREKYIRKIDRPLHIMNVVMKGVVLVTTKRGMKLCLLDLRKDACSRIGIPTDTVRAKNQAASWALGRDIYFMFPYIDGIIFPSRIDGEDNYMVFDRAIEKLEVIGGYPLVKHPEYDMAIARYDLGIVDKMPASGYQKMVLPPPTGHGKPG